MSLNEKSALAMGILSIVVLGWFASMIVPPVIAGGGAPGPAELPLILGSVLFIVASIVIQAVLRGFSPKDAARGEDDRDMMIMYKAGAYAGSFFGFVVVWGLFQYATTGNADAMFATCLIGLLAATAASFALQVAFYRMAH